MTKDRKNYKERSKDKDRNKLKDRDRDKVKGKGKDKDNLKDKGNSKKKGNTKDSSKGNTNQSLDRRKNNKKSEEIFNLELAGKETQEPLTQI